VILRAECIQQNRAQFYVGYQDQERKRVVKACRTEPVEEERVAAHLVWVEREEKKTIEYTELVAVKSEQTKVLEVTEPVWTKVDDPYTVKVPVLRQVEQRYTVQVPVVREVEFEYAVDVPVRVAERKSRTVQGVEPVVRKRTVTECIPVATTQVSNCDYGHWESRWVEEPVSRRVRGQGWVTTCRTVCQRVWVPHIVQQQSNVIVQQQQTYEQSYIDYVSTSQQIEYDCVAVCFQQEKRIGRKHVVSYEEQPRIRMVTVADYVNEPRTRPKYVLELRTVPKSVTYPVITYQQVPKSKEITYNVKVPESRLQRSVVTTHHTITEDTLEDCEVRVPVPMMREVAVQVRQLVADVVSSTFACCGLPAGR
jgi:hypothetical protein